MNVLPEVVLDEQENHSPSEVVGLVKPSVLTFPYSPENTNDKEEKLSPQSVLDPTLREVTSPVHKALKHGIKLKERISFGTSYNLNSNNKVLFACR